MKGLLLALITAYIMPSYGVLKRYANQRDELATTQLKAEGVAAVAPVLARDVAGLLGVTWNSGELMLNASMAVRFPGRCRLELSSPDSTRTLAAASSGGKVRAEGGELAALQLAVQHACAVLAVRSGEDGATREAVLKHLAALKVETKTVSLARFAGTVSYVIGQRADGQASLWLYKDRFLPSRLKFTDEGGAAWDVRFLDYTSQATGEAWPRVIELYKGNEAQLRVMVLNANTKADLSSVKF